jgi:hypothetical protein
MNHEADEGVGPTGPFSAWSAYSAVCQGASDQRPERLFDCSELGTGTQLVLPYQSCTIFTSAYLRILGGSMVFIPDEPE